MARYQVTFLVRDWVSVDISAPDEETAKDKAKKIVNCGYKNIAVEVNDGKTEYVGITNMDVLDKMDE